MDIAVLVKGRFETLPDASARSIGANAYAIEVPITPERTKRVRRGGKAEDWDGAVFLLDDEESQPAMGSAEGPNSVTVTVLLL